MATRKPSSETAAYLVGACPIAHDGDTYQPGAEIALTEAEAKRLSAKVQPAPAKTTKE